MGRWKLRPDDGERRIDRRGKYELTITKRLREIRRINEGAETMVEVLERLGAEKNDKGE